MVGKRVISIIRHRVAAIRIKFSRRRGRASSSFAFYCSYKTIYIGNRGPQFLSNWFQGATSIGEQRVRDVLDRETSIRIRRGVRARNFLWKTLWPTDSCYLLSGLAETRFQGFITCACVDTVLTM